MIKTTHTNIKKAVKNAIMADMIPMIVGAHGIGKTEAMTQLCLNEGWNFTAINISNLAFGVNTSN